MFPCFYSGEVEPILATTRATDLPPLQEIAQSILHLKALDSSGILRPDEDQLLLELANHYLTLDTPLSLSYLFNLQDPLKATDWFDQLLTEFNEVPHSVERIIQYACYFFAFRELSLISAKDKLESYYKLKTDAVIELALETFSDLTKFSPPIQSIHQSLLKYHHLLQDSSKAKELIVSTKLSHVWVLICWFRILMYLWMSKNLLQIQNIEKVSF